ncbi:Major facilitator superfamily domain-containing 8 [Brachionus plicatilis]|uniref:Major facilitator superfamily domain-containing 8 n=1 Tax=Brachionus plicatilis TaxID=10195 RepID=A0A3M7RKT7_BRAPC|nr:Major facilitator superfamily domain-containing 8 [Brachionus plicatilis]
MDEHSPLLKNYGSSINQQLPKYITRPKIKNQSFRFCIPSQETEKEKRDRFFSIKVCYVCMFLSAVSFTITISSIWPFLQIIDETTDTEFFGWIVSSFSIGQLLSSPLFGYWSNRISCHKIPILVTMVVTIIGNLVYIYLQDVGEAKLGQPKIWMLSSRFIMGIGASTAAIIRSYASTATIVSERTAVLANISACQGLGFIIGPVLQALLVPVGFPGIIDVKAFHLNFYTSPAVLSIIIYLILIGIVLLKFNEYVVIDNKNVDKLLSVNSAEDLSESYKHMPPADHTAITLALILFFINCFIFSFFETLSTPLTIDMYAWSKSEATLYNGLILGGFGILGVIVVLMSKFLTKKFKEKTLMLFGYILLFVAVVAFLPWGDNFPSVQIPTIQPGQKNTTSLVPMNTTTSFRTSSEEPPRGCPLDYDWCFYTPIVQFFQFLIGFALLITGYSIANVMSFAIYSKLLGPKPQGLMMGILTSCGSLSRAVGPIVVSYLYGLYGPRVSFISLSGIVILAILIIVFTFKRYEPYKF